MDADGDRAERMSHAAWKDRSDCAFGAGISLPAYASRNRRHGEDTIIPGRQVFTPDAEAGQPKSRFTLRTEASPRMSAPAPAREGSQGVADR